VPYPAREPTFLPLTVSAVGLAVRDSNDIPLARAAETVRLQAETANSAAADCWTAMLAGCDCPSGRALPVRLRELTEAIATYAGMRWWYGEGSVHRRRVADAEDRIAEAVRDGDGAEFAEAFIGYDQALATVIVGVRSRMGITTP